MPLCLVLPCPALPCPVCPGLTSCPAHKLSPLWLCPHVVPCPGVQPGPKICPGLSPLSSPQALPSIWPILSPFPASTLRFLDCRLDCIKVVLWHVCVEGYQPYRRSHLSMHQMGTCRMGASPNSSVADSEGQCWDVAGLYIADASCFPTSSGHFQHTPCSINLQQRPAPYAPPLSLCCLKMDGMWSQACCSSSFTLWVESVVLNKSCGGP